MEPTPEFLEEKAEAQATLKEFTRKRDILKLDVDTLVREHRECYLWDEKLRQYSYHSRTLWMPYDGAADLKRRIHKHIKANNHYMIDIRERLASMGPDGEVGLRTILYHEDIRYSTRVANYFHDHYPDELEQRYRHVLPLIVDKPGLVVIAESIQEWLAIRESKRLSPATSQDSEGSLAPTLSETK